MSHDRGCFVCYEDNSYGCAARDCPRRKTGRYSSEAIEQRRLEQEARDKERAMEQRKAALNFWLCS